MDNREKLSVYIDKLTIAVSDDVAGELAVIGMATMLLLEAGRPVTTGALIEHIVAMRRTDAPSGPHMVGNFMVVSERALASLRRQTKTS